MILLLCAAFAHPQGLDLRLQPVVGLPLGAETIGSWKAGGGLGAGIRLIPPRLDWLALQADLAYQMVPTLAPSVLANRVTAGLSAGIVLSPWPALRTVVGGGGGYSLWLGLGGAGGPGGAPYLEASIEAEFRFDRRLSAGAGVSCKTFFWGYTGLEAFASVGLALGSSLASRAELSRMDLAPVFPVFLKTYASHPLGEVAIRNSERGAITDVELSFEVPRYMDAPRLVAEIPRIEAGDERAVAVTALFNDRILEVTEGTKVTATLVLSYDFLGTRSSISRSVDLAVLNRNAMTWADDRCVASFVTARDPAVLALAKSAAGIARDSPVGAGFDLPFRQAMGIFEAVSSLGINYVADPATPYAESSASGSRIDFLQFPSQTLAFKAGDCDDLSILFCALLEAAGIETAFMTVPGHIFVAFALEGEASSAGRAFVDPEDLVDRGAKAWVPLEVTMLHDGMTRAWREGAAEWRAAGDQAAFYPVREAWKDWEPTAFVGSQAFSGVDAGEVAVRYTREFDRFARAQVAVQEAVLKEELARKGDASSANRLGVLYARFGLFAEAEPLFRKAGAYLPALLNLANLQLAQGDIRDALTSFESALVLRPGDTGALLGVARANYELENWGKAKNAWLELQRVDARRAAAYAYLGQASGSADRAASPDARRMPEWRDGEGGQAR